MGKNILTYIFILIFVFLVVFYYVGSTNVLIAGKNFFTSLINALMGKDVYGNLPTSYPKA